MARRRKRNPAAATPRVPGQESLALRLPPLLVDFIRSERLKPHQAFLSRREVSERWKVNLTRVHEVFNDLENRGVLYSLPRRGTFVSPVVRHQQLLVVTGDTPEHALRLGGVVDFLGGCQEAVRVGSLPYGIFPISWQEISEHLGDFTLAFPHVAGILLYRRCQWVREFRAVAANRKIPCAFYGSDTWLSALDGVHRLVYEERSLLSPIVDHLVDRGHRRLVFAGRKDELVERRKQFFLERLAHHGIPQPEEEIRYALPTDPAPRYADMEKRILELKSAPTAIVCAEDQTALLVVHALARLGKKVPEDIAVTGIDNAAYSRDAVVPITTMNIPVFEDARALLTAFVRAIETPPHGSCLQLRSRPRFLERESTLGMAGL
jgi:hypothetical protein